MRAYLVGVGVGVGVGVAALFAGCGMSAELDAVEGTVTDSGTVYSCTDGVSTVELCFDGEATDLADEMRPGWSCRGTNRSWPAITNDLGVGCWYHCTGGPGCNALNGCWCPVY